MSAEPLVVTSSSIEQRRPGLGARLMRGALAAFVGLPAFVATILTFMPPSFDGAAGILAGFLVFFAIAGIFVAPVVAVGGGILASVSLPQRSAGTLRADEGGLVVARGGAVHRFSRAQIESGLVLPGAARGGQRPRVAFYLRNGGVVMAEVPDGVAAHRLLDRLGVDPARRRVAVSIGSAYRQLFVGCASVPIVVALFAIPLGYLVTEYPAAKWPVVAFGWSVVLVMFVIARLARPREVLVGSDGLRIRGPFRDRWIPHSRIRSIEEKERALWLDVSEPGGNGVRIEVATGEQSFILALAGRIRLAIALGSNGAGGPPVGAELDPAGKSFTEWKDKLQALLMTAGYRKTAVTPEELLSVVEDPDLPPGQRLGAAMALRIAQHPEARTRIRVAADACADEAMKCALEEAAEGELGERALRRVLD